MQVWEVKEEQMIAYMQPFTGFSHVDVDLLFVVEAVALREIYQRLKNGALTEFKKLIRQGEILFYVMKSRDELDAMGYEELIERFGIPWLGTCH